MRLLIKLSSITALFFLISACALRGLYYLGFHGPSIKVSREVHEGFSEDLECLDCHHPDNAGSEDAPPTTHPGFHGCLKCHNDDPGATKTKLFRDSLRSRWSPTGEPVVPG